ncbi:MAG: DUF4974 domain-containing protein [Sphingobacteriales bacterium]|nr:MAG: DUF4974 domain-containing protein [Sphingobacteriales bacterium]
MDELIYTSIARQLSGEATAADNAAIQQWLAEDEANAGAYEKLRSAWENAAKLFETTSFDTASAWNKVSARMQQAPEQKTRTFALPAWTKYSIAAAAVAILGLFIWRAQDNGMVTITASVDNQVVTLADNSKITMRKGSVLHYPKHFEEKQRNVSLEGEAFFDVAHNEQSPFLIDAQSATVKVLGTSFDVKCNSNAASVVVRTGKVQMTSIGNNEYVILTPGEKGSLKNGKLTEQNVSVNNYMYWQTGKMEFSNIALKDVVAQLSEITDSNITLNGNLPADMQAQLVNISFHRQSVEEMLNDICLITQTSWYKSDSAYVINVK